MIDLIFLAKNRLEFTKASFSTLIANTDWTLVRVLYVYDDGSVDGTRTWLNTQRVELSGKVDFRMTFTDIGSPAGIMRDFTERVGSSSLFAKIDNDVIVAPGWLNACANVMNRRPELDLLGIEPPKSRTPHFRGGIQSLCPELDTERDWSIEGYAPCDSIGGIGLMRMTAFRSHGGLTPHSIYGGFTEWQLQHHEVVKGWICPPLPVFLLDRMPEEPWCSLSREYIAKGWQRAWSNYDPTDPFWSWWNGSHQRHYKRFMAIS